ncbi:hypothetical protein U8V72_22780 [Priestia filamentosa]|uniref:hypothetical protein n=1 Tax=Priestia filamentosa TaxID=1402861 RepID=UPI00397B4AE0
MEKLLRAPVFQVLLLSLVGIIVVERNYSLKILESLEGFPLKYIFIGIVILWIILTYIYNYKNQEEKFNLFTLLPTEFREDDEGMKWITLRACKKVYIYYSFAIPLGIGLILYFSDWNITPFIVLIVLGLGQYLVYWMEIKKIYED